MTHRIDFDKFVPAFDSILARGLSSGLGERDGQMCIEAAVCAALDLPHGDRPSCVSPAIRSFKIALNDASWSSPEARARGLRRLGIAQVGSLGVVDDIEFTKRLSLGIVRKLIPKLFRDIFPDNSQVEEICKHCASVESLEEAAVAARAAAAAEADSYLILAAEIAFDVLVEMKSPGVDYAL